MDGQKRRLGRPATGRSVDSLEAQKFERAVWSGSRSRVWLTKRFHQTWEISKRMSLFKTDNNLRLGSSEKALNFLGYVTLEKRRESHVRNLVKKCLSSRCPQFFMHYFNYNRDVLPMQKNKEQ